jgi:Protein of unknown function (DUF2510)
MTTTRPAPGWYPDPSNPAYQRYWDGYAWTAATRTASVHDKSSESSQTHKSPTSKTSSIKTVGDWFNTGTAAVKFAKALLGLLAFLGIITVGGAIVKIVINPPSPSLPSNPPVAGGTLSSALLQPSDLGASGAVGWSQTQFPPSSSNPPSCPSYPQSPEGHVDTALTYAALGIDLYENVWKVANPDSVFSAYVNTAQNCSFPNNSGNTVTLQADDSAASYGDQSAVFTMGVTNTAFQNETPS